MSETEFPVELVERCAKAAYAGFHNARKDDTGEMVRAVLRESGHAELVAALKEARDFAASVESVEGDCYGDPTPRINAALRKAGAL